MLTRRKTVTAALAAILACQRAVLGKASQPATHLNFEIPPKACDCHTHIFADPKKFPFWPGRSYTPETALPDEMAALHRALRIERVVIVTPSVYGTDDSATLYGMRAVGPNARGVAVIDEKTSGADLEAMDSAGVRGVRLNLATAGQTDPSVGRRRFQALSSLLKRTGWHIQINTGLAVIAGMKEVVLDSPVPVVFDHFGGLRTVLGLNQPGFGDLVELVRSGKAYVKISAAYRASTQAPDYPDIIPFAKALISSNADRIIWGTDWPHPDTIMTAHHRATEVTPLLAIDDGRMLNQLAVWVPDASVRKRILVDNPARLYKF